MVYLCFSGYTGRLDDDAVDQFMNDLADKARAVLNEAKNRRVIFMLTITVTRKYPKYQKIYHFNVAVLVVFFLYIKIL